MNFADPIRLGLDEFGRDQNAFDGISYLYVNEDVRCEIGFDVEGAWRHWTSVGHRQGRYPPGLGRTAPRNIDRAALTERPFGLNLFGPFAAVSGLGTAARNLLAAVEASGLPFDVHCYDVETGHALITRAELEAPVRYRFNLVLANADQIRRVAGLYPDGTFDDAITIAVWAWELAWFRPDWQASFALVDEVWTNSHFELASIAAVSPVPVHLMPLPVTAPAEIDRAAARARFGLPADAFVALCAFDAGSTEERKNPFTAIGAFTRAFGTDPRRVLVVKHHGAPPDLSRRLLAARAGAANIRLIGARLSDADHQALQTGCDALLSAHRSEGFGFNLAEFLAAGKIVIGTDYSGSRDFLDSATGFPVAARLVEVGRRSGPYLAHAVWAEPDVDALAGALRDAAAMVPAAREAARSRMAAQFSVAAIAARIRDRLAALDGRTEASDGLAPTALASVARHVPPGPDRTRIAWPARLPMFTAVLEDAAGLDALRAQTYPFWEACLIVPALPEPEDAGARAALRGDDLRVRLLQWRTTAPPAIVAAEAGGGAWLLLLSPDDRLAADALLALARRLDRDAVPDMVSLGPIPLRPAAPVAVRKAALLQAWSDGASELDAALRRVRDAGCLHLPGVVEAGFDDQAAPDIRLPAGTRVSARVRGPCPDDAPDSLDLTPLPLEMDALAAARMIAAGRSAETVVIVDGGAFDPARIGRLTAWLGDNRIGAAAADGVFATRRSVLHRIARDSGEQASLERAAAGADVTLVRLPMRSGLEKPAATAPDDILDLAGHAERLAHLGLFDRDHYLVSSPDVAASGTDPLMHYVEYGWREHRAPNFYFDPVWYRARHMDDNEELDPLLHYARYRNSGVRPSRHFDPAWVRRNCQLPPGVDPLRYFLERRRTENVSPLPEFDPAWYRARRRDIVYRKVDPFEHYMRFGAAEGVNPSAEFDTAFYAARHMGEVGRRDPVANNPLLHYLEHRDRQPAIASLKAALRQEIARLQLLGRSFIEMTFCWFDGLPQRIDALRTYLSEPTLTMPFVLVFANEVIASGAARGGDARLLEALRLPLSDSYDDPDICARLAEGFADPRCMRLDGRPVLGMVRGAERERVEAFGMRLRQRLAAEHGFDPAIEFLD